MNSIESEIRTTPEKVYTAWLNSEKHSLMTGGAKAVIQEENGFDFEAWDGYITGRIIELIPQWKIVMRWRTSEFEENQPDSIVTVEFEESDMGCLLILTHENLPAQDIEKYKNGWKEYYFNPMKSYF